jgi:hypothetical protein
MHGQTQIKIYFQVKFILYVSADISYDARSVCYTFCYRNKHKLIAYLLQTSLKYSDLSLYKIIALFYEKWRSVYVL